VRVPTLAEARKGLAAVAGVAAEAVALGVLHGATLNIAQLIIAAATAVGVYAVPNAPEPAP